MIDHPAKSLIYDYFDPIWYLENYHDVNYWSGNPFDHFKKYGKLLKRSPGPEFNSRFYLETYSDAEGSNLSPIEHFLSCPDYSRRPVTAQQLRALMYNLSMSTKSKWEHTDYKEYPPKIITYCIPVLGRLDDLKQTLKINLDENRGIQKEIEFIVIDFSKDREVISWIEKTFPDEITSGYLRTVHEPNTLDNWHFGKAKNAFRSYLRGRIYSSLDGDNFVTIEETLQLLDLERSHPNGFVFHHFSGQWGDGTSGRVSMPAAIYRHVGYNPKFLPRQFDEMDLILGALIEFPALPFIGVDPVRNAFTLSSFVQTFIKEEQLPNRMLFYKLPLRRISPLNPRGSDYTDDATHWRDMNNFNAAFTALRRGRKSSLFEKNIALVDRHKHKLVESLPKEEVLKTLFWNEPFAEIDPIEKSDICVLTCVRNEKVFLRKFVEHHRNLGVTHFLIVDDNSDRPVSDMNLGRNVLVVRPKVGDFRTAKTLWLEGLMKTFLSEGSWACTLDADEMLHLPEGMTNLQQVINQLETSNQDYAACLLLDMLPDPDLMPLNLMCAEDDFYSIFTQFLFRDLPVSEEYARHRSIKWGFGRHAKISNRIDARYHAFGTFDSLRKLSLFRYYNKRHLNQGFHSFHYLDKTPSLGEEIWQTAPILPIFHYKLAKVFSGEHRTQMLDNIGEYHTRTSQNISQIFTADIAENIKKIRELKPFLRHNTCVFDHWPRIISSGSLN